MSSMVRHFPEISFRSQPVKKFFNHFEIYRSHNKNNNGSDQSINTSPIVRNKYALVSLVLTLTMDLALGTEKVFQSLQLDY